MFQENEGQDFFTKEEKIVLRYMDAARKRTEEIGSRKKVDCFGFLYCSKIIPLNKSLSKSVEMGLDPNDSFNLSIKIKDKKTGMVFDITLEGIMSLISEIKHILKIDSEDAEFRRGLFNGNVAVSLKENDIFELAQTSGLMNIKIMFIHKISMVNLIKIENILLMYSKFYDDMANKFIGFIKKYVLITRSLINEGVVKENKLFAIQREVSLAKNLKEGELEFLADTLVKFPMYFESFF